MVFKVLIVILTLIVIENSAQHFNRIDIDRYDLYKYGFIKDIGFKRDENKEPGTAGKLPHYKNAGDDLDETKQPKAPEYHPYDKNTGFIFATPKSTKQDIGKRAWRPLGLIDMLRAMPYDHYDPVIFVPEEYESEDKLEK